MLEQDITVDHSTLHRWILKVTSVFTKIAKRYKRPLSQFWHIDETYIKIKGQWYYLYRAIHHQGKTVDFLLTKHRDTKAA